MRVSVLAHYPSWYASNLFKIDLGFCALVCRLAGRCEAGGLTGPDGSVLDLVQQRPDATPVTVQGWAEGTQ